MAQVLSKEYTCYNCKKPILISKIDNPSPGSRKKWDQWELDSVTPHQCKKQQEQDERQEPIPKPPVQQVDNGPQIAVLAELVRGLTEQVKGQKESIDILNIQIQALRSDKTKKK